MTRTKVRGFTLIEMVVAMVVLATLLAIAIPAFNSFGRNQQLSMRTRELRAKLLTARAFPSRGDQTNATPMLYSGIRFVSKTRYVVFADHDADPSSGEVDLETVDLLSEQADSPIEIIAPDPGTEIRFRSGGLHELTSPHEIALRNRETGEERKIKVNGGGLASIE